MMVQDDNGRDDDQPYDGEDFGQPDSEELELAEDDGPLPWLESDYDEQEQGYDTGRLIGFSLIGVLALAALIGAIWFFTNRSADPDLIADGGTIEAPEGPMKERPDDAGGKTFAGTGNVAPGVGEGQTRESRLANDAVPKPSIDAATTSAPAATESQSAAVAGVAVQVGAFSSRESAVAGWSTLVGQTDALKGAKYRIEQGKADIGTVYRLQAMANNAAAANALCSALKADGVACQVKN